MKHEVRRRDLCARLQRWRNWGALNEEATIQGLVLPVLKAAGYDTYDPEQVYPQPRDSQGKYPDLMLYKTSPVDGGVEWCVIEAKKLSEMLDKFVSQIGQYLPSSRARWYALTNGAEWRFYDKHRGQSNFHCITLTLETPGALDALCRLLDRSLHEPDLDSAFAVLIEAQLQATARQTSWDDHRLAWRLTRTLVYSLREATDELKDRFPEHAHLVAQWESDFKGHLEQGDLPKWWVDAVAEADEQTTPAPAAQPTAPAAVAEPISVVYRRGIALRGYSPSQIYIRGQAHAVSDWIQALMTLISVLDEAGCLSEPPCPPGRTWGAYDSQPHKWIKPRVFQSKQHGRLFVNKHGSAPQLAERIYSVAAHSKCPDVTPDSVLIQLRKREER
ncbi:MAG: type I restriction enzyme HsdR N-terminal domain-containing protein [Fimbriimonadales bacterium]|nr:type I restriction enzyme HsdR N-terminal domain-containing protein [Fimbriimonadales bacterium]